jgi:4-amino-4-deoxy-L-arabinose transferase-like glycosyltransferase
MALKNKKIILAFLIILSLAIFFRFWHLDSIPSGIYPDEAMNANDAITSPGKLFYDANNGREGLFINLIALSFSIFGISIWSFKFVSALAGVLTVIGIYFLGKEMFQKKEAGLLSAFFLAVSFWHVNFSRIGFRAILVPLVMSFSFYFLLKGFRTGKIYNLAAAGLIFGLGFHTYISFRLAVLIIPIILAIFIWNKIKNKQGVKKALVSSVVFLAFAFIAGLPIGIYFLQNPEDFISRATGVSIFSQDNPIFSFVKSLTIHLGMFNFYGDANWRHNFSQSPQLYWPVGIFFLLGLGISIKKLISSLKTKKGQELITHSLLLSWLFIMLLPGILTYEGIPHALRVIGCIIPAYLLAGLGAWQSYLFVKERTARKTLLKLAGCLLLTAIVLAQFDKYFIKWAQTPEVENYFTKNYTQIGLYLNSLPAETVKYVVVNELGSPLYGISIPGQTPMFIERITFNKPRANYIKAEDLDTLEANDKQIVIIPLYDKGIQLKLENKFTEINILEQKYFKAYIIY